MLKNIRLHIEEDEEKQIALEDQLARHITQTHKENINTFQRFIPSLIPLLNQTRSQNISIFCNKNGKFNIVDYGLGRVFYGFHPEQEIQHQVDSFLQHSLFIDFENTQESVDVNSKDAGAFPDLPAYQNFLLRSPLPRECELLIVLGLGLGYHVKQLIKKNNIKHLIIYEPEEQYFICSAMVTKWRETLEIAKQKGTSIYFQIGKDGRDIVNDVSELREHFSVSGIHLFQHYQHTIFDSIWNDLSHKAWPTIVENGLSFNLNADSDHFCPTWSPPIALEQYSSEDVLSECFKKNLQAFAKYFPAIHHEFKDYRPHVWIPIVNHQGQVNLIKKDNLVSWYGDNPKQDCIYNFTGYARHPHKDGLVLGYTGEKLKKYVHYQFVKEADELLVDLEEQEGTLPSVIKSIIMFGLGAGYQLEYLIENHEVDKLFICEPNRDFFYASLYAIDWVKILNKVDQNEQRIYINIGDDGTNLFRDLLNQFYAIGPYILSQTYFYQSYHNSALLNSIAQLREQLQVVISMGEYFDHAKYGIAHTKEALLREYPHMLSGANKKLSFVDKEIPVFLVGNGPSLDHSISAIKDWQGSSIIVSCGTALKVLYKNGIVPDFHAEIEQNRSTFDWAIRTGELSFLKQISLISCNGIHPDTCDLYKDVYIAFKEGESSTVSTLNVVGEENYETLQFAFPTVTNFAINFFIKLGFSQLYLIGVDLGFVDDTKHHSVQSGYYDENGMPLYDYAAKNNTSMTVAGNFRKTVYTKHEFKIAKIVMEQSLVASNIDCYNTSDGARIVGADALPIDNILISVQPQKKRTCLKNMTRECFKVFPKQEFFEAYEQKYSCLTLSKELSIFRKRLEQPVDSFKQAELLIESQKRMLFASYQQGGSLLFYYLYGTVNYANVVLNKVAHASSDGTFDVAKFNEARELWLKYFSNIADLIVYRSTDLDASSSLFFQRILTLIKKQLPGKHIKYVSDSKAPLKPALFYRDTVGLDITIDNSRYSDFCNGEVQQAANYDFIIFDIDTDFSQFYEVFTNLILPTIHSKECVLITREYISEKVLRCLPANLHILISPGDYRQENGPEEANSFLNLHRTILYLSDFDKFDFLMPKYTLLKDIKEEKLIGKEKYNGFSFYDLGYVIGAKCNDDNVNQVQLVNGTRPAYLGKGLTIEILKYDELSETEFHKSKDQTIERLRPFLKEYK